MSLKEFIEKCENLDHVYIYDTERDYLDCGLGCHVKYFDHQVLKIWLGLEHICVMIDYQYQQEEENDEQNEKDD